MSTVSVRTCPPCQQQAGVLSPSGARVILEDPAIARPVVLLAGATATGKSDLAIRLAEERAGVVVNADSQQLYDGMRILSARPSPQDEARVPHRLFGVADPAAAWSTGQWLRGVQAILEADDRPLIIVGGTGLYFHALTRGLAPTPPIDPDIRNVLSAEFEQAGEAAIRARLAAVDPEAEARIGPADRQRLIRALAVAESTGRSLSSWQAEPSRPLLTDSDLTRYVLEREREDLYARCDRRVDSMVEAGAIDEVRNLLARRLASDLPAMKAVGVRELTRYLAGDHGLDEAVAAMKVSTRQYAKRQLTWFRNQTPDWPRIPALSE